jgi:ABC-type antimicrobial peptide transport system permease subunit
MSAKLFRRKNSPATYLIVLLIILAAFFLLGGGPWIKGLTQGGRSAGMNSLHWPQILISLGIGFLLGFIVARRKW